MSYSPITDFLALLRQTGSAVNMERMPGIDFVIAALSRLGQFNLFVGQSAPIVNQPTTVWFKPALPSWTAEGTVYLWNAATAQYEIATPALWNARAGGYSFQSVTASNGIVTPGTTVLAVQRTAPLSTVLTLPSLAAQFATGKQLQIVDFSTGILNQHIIFLSPPDGATIMQQGTWQIVSTPDQLAGVTLQPSPDLNAWIIAP